MNDLTPIITRTAAVQTSLRLPLIELCLSSLKLLSTEQHQRFINLIQLLISADKKTSVMEWALYRIVLHNTPTHTQRMHHYNLRDLPSECQLLLSLLAASGAASEAEAKTAFDNAAAILNFPGLEYLPRHNIKLIDVDTALERLNLTKPLQKPQLLKAMSQCILHDGKVSTSEAEVFRAIAHSLDCPIPPLIPRVNQ